jgi:hypothetical protein
MSQIQRICAQCGQSSPLEARHCTQCGFDFENALPAQHSNLPVLIGRAALPILAGAASLAVRAGWKLLQSRLAQAAAQQAVKHATQPPAASRSASVEPQRTRRATIHIRSSWAVGDANGVWRRGSSEHTIEVEE